MGTYLETMCYYKLLYYCPYFPDADYWTKLATEELEEALKIKWNLGRAKNVILFIGDGMGPTTVTATRIYKGGESYKLAYEQFPNVGLLKVRRFS